MPSQLVSTTVVYLFNLDFTGATFGANEIGVNTTLQAECKHKSKKKRKGQKQTQKGEEKERMKSKDEGGRKRRSP